MEKHDKFIVDMTVTIEDIQGKLYTCNFPTCGKQIFTSEKSLKKHVIIKHHNIKISQEKLLNISYRFNCPIATCRRNLKLEDEYFKNRKHLVQHYFKVHNAKQFKCSKLNCLKKFSTEMLRNLHSKNCGQIFTCCCKSSFNSKEAMLTHIKRKHSQLMSSKKEKVVKETHFAHSPLTKEASTATSSLEIRNLHPEFSHLSSLNSITTPAPIPSDKQILSLLIQDKSTSSETITNITKLMNSSASTTEILNKEENSNSLSSSSSQTKRKINWSIEEAFDDSLFDSDAKMEFYSTETQTDFVETYMSNSNYTQTTFTDFYDFGKFDIQTQTNWDE
ncbi:CLUMA_CG011497, isoform A [Clunio marinus]|uniref:CLUMA_CG011497, isoform A n=1 Tax=Clunio marinus TaxID=568069 RepID=A0A1J1ID09_9DIPT|nr:CLUMA_CG011497, isoform A [Clunio marinus]